MNRTLLLLPVLALFLMACPQRHATTAISPPPGQPNADGYNQAPHGSTAPQSGTQPGYDGGGTVNVGASANSSGSSSNSSSNSNSNSNSSTVNSNVTNGNTATEGAGATVTTPTVSGADSATHVEGKPDSAAAKTRLVVSFTSKGGGIDMATEANFKKWLSKHPDVVYTVNPWGKEGERDYCFELKNQRGESQVKFVSDVRTFFGTNDRVLVQENVVCSHKHTNGEISGDGAVLPATDEPKIDSSNIARVVVSFISKGEGIDLKAQEKLEKWLSERGNVVWETKTFGREGEVNYCFFMVGKTTREQEIFVRDLRTFIGENDLVLVEEWAKCDRRKQ